MAHSICSGWKYFFQLFLVTQFLACSDVNQEADTSGPAKKTNSEASSNHVNNAGGDHRLKASRSIVGLSIYLPDQNLSAPIAEGRAMPIFSNLDDCVVSDPLSRESEADIHTWTTTKEFYNYFGSDSQLDASASSINYSVKTTLNALYSGSIEVKSQLAGAVYDFRAFKEKTSLRSSCEQGSGAIPLRSDVAAAFKALPYPLKSPDLKSEWEPYHKFLAIYGTHYVRQVQAGARFRSFTFKKSDKKTVESDLKIAACIQVDGNTGKGTKASVKGCENLTEKQRQSISSGDYTSKTAVYGGNEKLRNLLNAGKHITPELLAEFADSGKEEQDGVQYKLQPIWELLYLRATDKTQANKARSLQAYFEGFLSSNCQQRGGCGCSKIKDEKDNVTLRMFTQTDKEHAQYACNVPVMGCRNDNDCHYNAGKAFCQCYGDHCINVAARDGNVLSMGVNYDKKISGINTGPNKSCRLKGSCKCERPDNKAMWHTIWSS